MNTVLSNRWLLVAGLMLTGSTGVCAQSPQSPILSGDASLALQHQKGSEENSSSIGLALNLDHWSTANWGLFAKIAADVVSPFSYRGERESPPLPPGAPIVVGHTFGGLTGGALLFGGMVGRADTVQLRAAIGAGAYQNDGDRVYHGALVANVDGAFFPFGALGFFAGARLMHVPQFFGSSLTVTSAMLGIRLH